MFRDRYWNGSEWTNHVSNGAGKAEEDDGDVTKCEPPESDPVRLNAKNLLAYMAQSGKYADALKRGRLASTNVLGGSWNEYADTAISALMLQLLVSIDQRLEDLVDAINAQSV
jgi:hypothetical protein